MDLVALQIFKTVAEQGGITRAAAALHRVQSNVTTRVKQLEERLGTKLFHRQGRRLVLSSEGKVLLDYADRMLRLSNEARTRAAATDWLTFRGETLEEAATVHELAGDAAGANASRREALETYERKGNVVGAERMRRRLEHDA